MSKSIFILFYRMKAITHILFGILIYLLAIKLIIGSHNIVMLALILIGVVLPDIDIGTSYFGRKTKIFAIAFEHRGIVHSWIFLLLFSLIVYFIFGLSNSVLFGLAYLSHLFLDSLNPTGIAFLFPSHKRLRGSIRYNSLLEWMFILILIIVSVLLAL